MRCMQAPGASARSVPRAERLTRQPPLTLPTTHAEPLGGGDQRALGDLGVLGGIALDQFTVARPVGELLTHEGLGALLRARPAIASGRAQGAAGLCRLCPTLAGGAADDPATNARAHAMAEE